jgi:hypothetical protein
MLKYNIRKGISTTSVQTTERVTIFANCDMPALARITLKSYTGYIVQMHFLITTSGLKLLFNNVSCTESRTFTETIQALFVKSQNPLESTYPDLLAFVAYTQSIRNLFAMSYKSCTFGALYSSLIVSASFPLHTLFSSLLTILNYAN